MMDVSMTGSYLWSDVMSFCVLMICCVVYVECHGEIDGYNSCMWNLSNVSYSCNDGDYPYVVICMASIGILVISAVMSVKTWLRF